jgi:CheY-like chemotaxis protein
MSTDSASIPAKTILVVDDNAIILKTINLKLSAAGYRVVTAAEGSEAVAAVRKETPDLILLDVSFPSDPTGVPWDGFRVMQWFRRLETAQKIPIIIITGSDDPQFKERAAMGGAVAFFHKPIDHEDLLKVIGNTLNNVAPTAPAVPPPLPPIGAN